MQGSDAHLARSKSNGVEKRPPPPIRPKPTALSSPPTSELPSSSSSTSVSALASAFQQNRSITTDKAPGSFGDLRKTFEKNPNNNPLFGEQRPSTPNARSTSILHSQQGSSLLVPAPSSGSRPRSVSSPAPPHRESEEPSSASSVEGIDNSQPDFGNLRARFQSQASLSSVSLSKPVRLRAYNRRVLATELCGLINQLWLSAHFLRSLLD